MAVLALFGIDSLALPESLQEAVEHGEVFTRGWVVELVLDLVGYTPEMDLCGVRLVEPACGGGAFLGAIASRVSASCRAHGRPLADAAEAVRAFDLLDRNVKQSRTLVARTLQDEGWGPAEAERIAAAWVRQGDYLLQPDSDHRADYVVGNPPPYIRLEDVPDDRMAAYRGACPAMSGRADIYVGFYETALRSLTPGGRLGFICADRWMRNQYGRALRRLVARRFSMDLVLAMHDVDAFDEQVSAYPAITLISSQPQGPAAVADTTRCAGPRIRRLVPVGGPRAEGAGRAVVRQQLQQPRRRGPRQRRRPAPRGPRGTVPQGEALARLLLRHAGRREVPHPGQDRQGRPARRRHLERHLVPGPLRDLLPAARRRTALRRRLLRDVLG